MMTIRTSVTAAFTAAFSIWSPVYGAQHQEHQPAASQTEAGAATVQCAQAQPAIARTVDAAMTRLEASRQANSPSQMRAAIDDLQGALRELRSQLAPCAALQMTTGPHAGHGTPTAQQSPSALPAAPATSPGQPPPHAPAAVPTSRPAAGTDPHAGHAMTPAKPAPAKPGAPASKDAPAAKPPPPGDPHAGHGTPSKRAADLEDGKATDPVTGLKVDPATAPKATHQGRTYYFSSEEARKEFLRNPAKFVKKSKEEA